MKQTAYEMPTIEVIEVTVESGFAASTVDFENGGW